MLTDLGSGYILPDSRILDVYLNPVQNEYIMIIKYKPNYRLSKYISHQS